MGHGQALAAQVGRGQAWEGATLSGDLGDPPEPPVLPWAAGALGGQLPPHTGFELAQPLRAQNLLSTWKTKRVHIALASLASGKTRAGPRG